MHKNSFRYILFFLIILFSNKVISQECVYPLDNNPKIKQYINCNQPQKKHLINDSSLMLPFLDDFTNNDIFPNSKNWQDNYVYINNEYCYNPISFGVATFDGLDEKGNLYDHLSSFAPRVADGERFVRFPSVSLTPTDEQVDGFGSLDPTNIHNLAGKYRQGYGTPFDLEDLADSTGIDINNIRFVKIIDVVGCIQPEYASYDSEGNIVNDPWPTPFYSGGFDLDAVCVINGGTPYNNCNFEDLTIYAKLSLTFID
jgi:hypothetical protein